MSEEIAVETEAGVGRPKGSKNSVTAEAFVSAWHKYDSLKDVSKELGLSMGAIHSRAQFYKKQGVDLPKKTKRGTRLDVAKLNSLKPADKASE